MTDNEIITILECCASDENIKCCRKCALCEKYDCYSEISKNALDLINRKKAEVESLEETRYELACTLDEFKADISTAKSEAIKEFAERLTNKIFSCDVIGDRDNIGYIASDIHNIIDNLVNEMT